jgi:hypothetical protein
MTNQASEINGHPVFFELLKKISDRKGMVSDLDDSSSINPYIRSEPRIPCSIQDKPTLDKKRKILLRSETLENKKEKAKRNKIREYAEKPLNHAFVELPILCQEGKFCQFFSLLQSR